MTESQPSLVTTHSWQMLAASVYYGMYFFSTRDLLLKSLELATSRDGEWEWKKMILEEAAEAIQNVVSPHGVALYPAVADAITHLRAEIDAGLAAERRSKEPNHDVSDVMMSWMRAGWTLIGRATHGRGSEEVCSYEQTIHGITYRADHWVVTGTVEIKRPSAKPMIAKLSRFPLKQIQQIPASVADRLEKEDDAFRIFRDDGWQFILQDGDALVFANHSWRARITIATNSFTLYDKTFAKARDGSIRQHGLYKIAGSPAVVFAYLA